MSLYLYKCVYIPLRTYLSMPLPVSISEMSMFTVRRIHVGILISILPPSKPISLRDVSDYGSMREREEVYIHLKKRKTKQKKDDKKERLLLTYPLQTQSGMYTCVSLVRAKVDVFFFFLFTFFLLLKYPRRERSKRKKLFSSSSSLASFRRFDTLKGHFFSFPLLPLSLPGSGEKKQFFPVYPQASPILYVYSCLSIYMYSKAID